MFKTETIAGYECNCIYDKSGTILRQLCVMIGSPDHAGTRSKDGPQAKKLRREAKLAVMEATGLPLGRVTVASRFSRLVQHADGIIAARDNDGRVTGFLAV